MNIAAAPRKEPGAHGLPSEILEILADWLPSNDDPVRPLASVATLDESGYPDVRSLLLSEYDPEGFYFHTDARSRKTRQLEARPDAAFCISWTLPVRQLTVQGAVVAASVDECAAAYQRRPRYLQLLAWLNTPESASLDRVRRESEWAEFSVAHPDGTLQPPATWVGYRLEPVRVTFWHGSTVSPSRRHEFTLETAGVWRSEYLPG